MTERPGRRLALTGLTGLPGPLRALAILAAIVLAGAAVFGLWHVVVGGFVNGNPRATTFGVVLALASGLPLVVALWLVAHRRARPG